MRHATLAAVALFACAFAPWGPHAGAADNESLTAVEGLKVGHHTLVERPTGCTVVLAEAGAVAAVDVRGGAPGTRETDLLDPVNMVQQVHAIVLSGGSAFGLDAASGVVRYLEERNVGYETGVAKVPIVPAAILFDLGVGGKPHIRPDADCGYQAAKAASTDAVQEGSVGAGAGATVGRLGGPGKSMKAGIGTAAIRHADGLVVAALVAVNAVGDIVDPSTGSVLAGARTPDGKGLVDARRLLRAGMPGGQPPRPAENTTIGVVATNARLTQAELERVALMAHDGYARAISPSHTPGDGDTIFALATGTLAEPAEAPPGAAQRRLFVVGALAAEAMADAIVRAATQASGVEGIPAVRDLQR
jgi:L-aminopeptidase/D-esterase-like protein